MRAWEILGDPVHKQAGPLPYHVDDVMACWQAITAPVLWVEADQTNMWDWMGSNPPAASNWNAASATCATSPRNWFTTPATCCTTTSRKRWRR
jgi:hypothetical protein